MLNNLEQFVELIEGFDDSIKKFKKNKVKFEDNPDKYLVEFKTILEPINIMNSFIISETPEYKSYIVYFNNMIMSKLKHFFFKEHPIKSKNASAVDEDKITMYLRKVFLTEDKAIKKEFLLKYFLFLFLEFDFLYSKNEKKGYFTSFRMDKEKFFHNAEKLKKQLTSIKNSTNTEYNFKEFSVDIIARIVSDDFDSSKSIDSDTIFNDYIQKKEKSISDDANVKNDSSFFTIKKIVKSVEKKKKEIADIYMEPFSYYISYMMYKDAHILMQVADTKDVESYVRKYIQNIIELINLFGKFYTEKNIASNIFDKQLELIKNTKLLTRDFSLPKKYEESKKCFISFSDEKTYLKDMPPLNFNQYSLEKLIELDDSTIFNNLLNAMYNSTEMQKDKISLFATYSSGLFLSVLYKLLNPEKEIDIYMFSTFPVNDILPYYVKTDNALFPNVKNAKNIVVLDDIARSGFTFSLIKYSYERFTSKKLKANFLVLKKGKYLNNSEIKDMNIKGISKITVKRACTIDSLDYSNIFSDNFDLNSLFLNRDYTMYIINKFISKLEDLEEVSFFYGSGAGKVLALLVAYFLKIEGKKVFFNKRKENNIFVDLAYNSGFTLKRKKTLQDVKDFKHILVVKNFSKNTNIFSAF